MPALREASMGKCHSKCLTSSSDPSPQLQTHVSALVHGRPTPVSNSRWPKHSFYPHRAEPTPPRAWGHPPVLAAHFLFIRDTCQLVLKTSPNPSLLSPALRPRGKAHSAAASHGPRTWRPRFGASVKCWCPMVAALLLLGVSDGSP